MDSFCGSPFWDFNVTWNTNDPDFTPCFEKTVLVWVPCGFLWLFSTLQIYSAFRLNQGRIPFSMLGVLQEALSLVLVVLQVVLFAFTFRETEDPLIELHPVDQVEPAIKAITFILALLLQVYTKRKGIQSSAVLFIFWFVLTICSVFEFQSAIRSLQLEDQYNYQKVYTVITLISYPVLVIELFLNFFADRLPVSVINDDDNSEKHALISENEPCPQFLSSFPNQFTYQWVYPLLWKGYKKALEFSDLWDLNAEDKSYSVVERFNKYWKPELKRVQEWNAVNKAIYQSSPPTPEKENEKKIGGFKKKTASILPALCKANFATLAAAAGFKLVSDLLAFVSPQILDLLINHLEDSSEESWKGYLYMVVIFVAVMTQTLSTTNFSQRIHLTGMRVRATLSEAVYQKSLLVSSAARKESTIGEIVNLMSVDSQRFNDVIIDLNILWSAPLQITLAIYFLWAQLGPSVLAGVVILALLIPVNMLIANKAKALKVEQMKNKDDRVRLMNEILSGIKVLKLYAWEPCFEDKVEEIRKREINVLRRTAYLDSFGIFVWFMAPFLVSLASFATYVLIDKSNILDANKAFVSLTLFNIMRLPMSTLPTLVVQLVQTSVSLNRLNKFMNADEIDPEAVSHQHLENENVVSVEKGTFSWDETLGTPALRNINLQVKKGSLVAVVGTVGAGKSSLLSAILGEMEKLSGHVNTTGSMAYVSQQAWIQNATLRDNILFGRRFNPVLYDKILEACALKPDLKILPGGDQTEIGEKGINLSGGQKQRISLARAAYNGSEVYLLDDPLSAVDSHVGKHLFQNVIGPAGILQKKTRIVVTHGITYLPHADRIIVMNNGEISESGTFYELLSRKGAFADFLIQHASVEDLESADSNVVRQLEQVVGSKDQVLARQISNLSFRSKKGPPSFVRQESTWSMSSKMSSSTLEALIDTENMAHVKRESEPSNKLIEVEKTETGSIKTDVYTHYMKSMSWKFVLTSITSYVVMSGLSLYSNMWLSEWSTLPAVDGMQDIGKRNLYLSVYGGLGAGQAVAVFLANITMSLGILKAAEYLQKRMLFRVLRSPMSFFDTTPLGRIVNRFSKDVDVTDNHFPQILYLWMSSFFQVLSTLIVISIGTPFFLLVVIPIGIIYIGVQRFYVSTSRQLKRLDSVSRSPVFSHFSETLAGTSTIRAFNVQHQFLAGFEKCLDQNQSAYFPIMCTNRWLSLILESIGNLVVLFATLFALLSNTDGGSVGLSVSYALSITINLYWLVRVSLDIETNIVAVERIKEYGEVPQEAVWELPEQKPPSEWPQNGNVIFGNYQSRYRDGLDLVLRGVTCNIKPGEKVGIVGRTGAGKSSLTLGLFRIVEAAGGSIEIDGKDISQMGLHDVRGRLTIIPQDPVLFAGTLRLNLDPYGKYSDDSVWHALEYAHLKQFVAESQGGLDLIVNENGENFSIGQRQLVCLARALLRKTKILILDEATAAVDLETDDLIQKTIRTEFKDCTVLTVAHRLNTIMDCDRIMVLDKGEISEFDSPQNLMKDTNTIFYGMAKDAGITSA